MGKSAFVGRQLSRLKMGQSYYSIIMTTISAISLVSIAFEIEFLWLLVIFPAIMIFTFFLGYLIDKKNIAAEDNRKSSDMLYRFVNVGDLKAQEFQMFQTEVTLEALKSLQEKQPINMKSLQEKYDAYLKKWESKPR